MRIVELSHLYLLQIGKGSDDLRSLLLVPNTSRFLPRRIGRLEEGGIGIRSARGGKKPPLLSLEPAERLRRTNEGRRLESLDRSLKILSGGIGSIRFFGDACTSGGSCRCLRIPACIEVALLFDMVLLRGVVLGVLELLWNGELCREASVVKAEVEKLGVLG